MNFYDCRFRSTVGYSAGYSSAPLPHQRPPETVKSQVHVYADDCLIYWEINNFSDRTTLQEGLKSLEQRADRRSMRFNATKCYIMNLPWNLASTFMYSLNNTILQSVTITV